jgi:hypothetical protein
VPDQPVRRALERHVPLTPTTSRRSTKSIELTRSSNIRNRAESEAMASVGTTRHLSRGGPIHKGFGRRFGAHLLPCWWFLTAGATRGTLTR